MSGTDASFGSRSILIVEDHVDTAEMLAIILKGEGYRVQWTKSAREALDLYSTNFRPDLILLDLTLPDMGGEDMVERLMEQKQEVPPILLISAKPVSAIEEAVRATRAVGMVRKPFDIDELLQRVEAALAHKTTAGPRNPSG